MYLFLLYLNMYHQELHSDEIVNQKVLQRFKLQAYAARPLCVSKVVILYNETIRSIVILCLHMLYPQYLICIMSFFKMYVIVNVNTHE